MTKDKLKVENVREDLLKVANVLRSRKSDRREGFIIIPVFLAIGLGAGLRNVWVTLPFIAFAVFHIIKLIPELRRTSVLKKKILASVERGDFSVSVERLSHVSSETVYEPHARGGKAHSTREIRVLYFLSGCSWRIPEVSLHYEWSKEMKMSIMGILHTSVKDNDFYVVTLKGHPEIAYAYNTKMFEFDDSFGE